MKGHFVFKTPDIATTPTYSIPPPSLPFRSSFPVLSPSFARHPSSLPTLIYFLNFFFPLSTLASSFNTNNTNNSICI